MMNAVIPFLPFYQICIDTMENSTLRGRIYYRQGAAGIPFIGIEELILTIDGIMDRIDCPQSTIDKREFQKNNHIKINAVQKRKEIMMMRKLDINENTGEKATFILQVKFRQNASWQGSVQWLEAKKTLQFRSALELIKIIDSACEAGYQVQVEEREEEVL